MVRSKTGLKKKGRRQLGTSDVSEETTITHIKPKNEPDQVIFINRHLKWIGREREREEMIYKMNRSFNPLDEPRGALILSWLVPVVPPNELPFHVTESSSIPIPIHWAMPIHSRYKIKDHRKS